MTKIVRGFYIRAERAGNHSGLTHAWAEKGTLPQEWEEIKKDETVVKAEIFSSTQRNRKHQNRRIIDRHSA